MPGVNPVLLFKRTPTHTPTHTHTHTHNGSLRAHIPRQRLRVFIGVMVKGGEWGVGGQKDDEEGGTWGQQRAAVVPHRPPQQQLKRC